MESALEPPQEARSEPVCEKRPAAEGLASPPKKSKGRRVAGNVKEVAEMVLVLAAMGKMRGGKGPSDVEKELMSEARNRLTKVCEGFAPKDVFPSDAFGGLIEDLGLNKLKEQRLGFRPPKISIADKLLISKRKMEKAEVFSLPTTPHSSRLHPNSGAAVDGRNANASHSVRMSQPDKSSNMPISSGSFQSASPLPHSAVVNSTSLPYQLPTSEIRPIVSNTVSSSHLNSAASPRVEWPHLRSDGRPNGSSHPSQAQANYSANSTVRNPTWPVQPQSSLTSKTGSDNKVAVNMSLKVDGVKSGMAPQTSRTVVSQTIGGPPSQGSTNHVQPLGNAHNEIGKTVQKLLRPRVSERPTWTSPSRDYMNKALTCHICMSMVTEIDSILICDACEKGYHLKCLQSTTQKGVPRGEWHCGKCLSFTNGKPLPPKYGRVMRNMNTPKAPSNLAANPSTSSKTIGALDGKTSQSKAVVNGNTVVENSERKESENIERKESKVVQESANASSSNKTNADNLMKTPSSSAENTGANKVAELNPNSSTEAVMVLSSSDKLPGVVNAVEACVSKQSLENHLVGREESRTDVCSNNSNSNQLKEQEIVRDNPSGVAASVGTMNQGRLSSDGLHAVNWAGDPVKSVDEKVYYASCCIKGHLYKAMDHVIVRFDNGKLMPSKLQAMWEDKNTTMKWIMVNQCYFPGDLPEAVGRPCGLESSEVYESTCGRAFMASSIEGPCEVLPPWRFTEETERRTRLGNQINDKLPPLYLCRWIYDEGKGLFRDISC